MHIYAATDTDPEEGMGRGILTFLRDRRTGRVQHQPCVGDIDERKG